MNKFIENNPFDVYTEEYEDWFKKNKNLFQSEVLLLQKLIPQNKLGLEVGIGSGLFAEKLNISYGIDPSDNMLKYAKDRNINVVKAFAESLPYNDNYFDFACFITSICFIKNPNKAVQEAHRVLKNNAEIIIAFIDKESNLGRILLAEKANSKFYNVANFYTVKEIINLLETNSFKINKIMQTLINFESNIIEQAVEGYGKGSFVAIKAVKI